MTICLDTNAYSKMLQPDGEKTRDLIEQADQVLVPATVVGELTAGFRMGSRAETNFSILEEFLDEPGTWVVAIDRDIAERYGRLVAELRRAGTPIPTNDIWIAAVAFEKGARLLSYDAHFARVAGLVVLAP
jgi:tRNA(fMet)-specific endonuclease VapC